MNTITPKPIVPLTNVDIVCSIYNQERIITRILDALFQNTITPFRLILVFDGCTDQSESFARAYLQSHTSPLLRSVIIRTAPNVYETRANNIGLKLAEAPCVITIQDDMEILERGWEIRLTYPLRAFAECFAVTARAAMDINGSEPMQGLSYTNRAGREFFSLTRTTFSIREVINRGPIAFRTDDLQRLGYLDETYAPGGLDDADVCLRAWTQYRLVCGAFWINYRSKTAWSKTKSADSTMNIHGSQLRNAERIMRTYAEYFAHPEQHSIDITIPSYAIDYPQGFSLQALAWHVRVAELSYVIDRLAFYARRLYGHARRQFLFLDRV